MAVEIEITELNDYSKCIDYINKISGHITTNMLKKNCGVSSKIARCALRNHTNTMLCNPFKYGSNQNINYNLYKKLDIEELNNFCKNEINNIRNKKSNYSEYFMNKYHIKYID